MSFTASRAGLAHHRLNSSPRHFGDSILWFLGLLLPPEIALQRIFSMEVTSD